MTAEKLLESDIEIELPKSFQPLQSLIASASKSVSDHEFFHQLCENVMSLLQTIPLLGPLRATWQNERSECLSNISKNEDLAKRQVKKIYAFFQKLNENTQFRSINGFTEGLKKVEDLLENRDRYYTPPEYEVTYDEFCALCSLLFDNGQSDVLKDLLEIAERSEYVFEDGSYTLKSIPFISRYCFCPAVHTVKQLRSKWNWNNHTSIWMAWNHLCNASWAWHTPFDFFAHEKMRSSTPILRRRTMRLLELQNCLREMHELKTQTTGRPNRYFKKSRFQQFLKIIITQVAVELAKSHTEIYEKDEVYVHAIELMLNGDELWIKVEWKKDLPAEQFCLKVFQYESLPHEFLKMLIKTPSNAYLTVPGRSPADLINRCNLGKGGLKGLFFGKCTKAHALFKGCRAENQAVSGEVLKELLEHLQKRHRASGSPICP